MARKVSNKPWFHEASGFYCTTHLGKRVYLDKDPEVAQRKLKKLRSGVSSNSKLDREWLDATFAELTDEFINDVRERKGEDAATSYKYRLLRALKVLGAELRVGQMKRFHLKQVERSPEAGKSPSTVRDTLGSVIRVFNWAVDFELLDANPFVGYRKPKGRQRTRIVSDDEFWSLLRHSHPSLRNILLALRFTGCRPKELRTLVWEWVDLEEQIWKMPVHKTIDQQTVPRPRIVPLHPLVHQLCRRLHNKAKPNQTHVFLNGHGKPYTKDCLCRAMANLRERAGIQIKSGEQLVLYSNRHTFATHAVGKVSDLELAELLGQTDVRTTQRYTHISPQRLKEIARRARGAG